MNLKHKDYVKSLILILVFFINSLVSIAGPFPADLRDGFLIQDLGSGNIRVNQIDLITGNVVKSQELSVGGNGNNAYGYNPKDNYIYGIQVTTTSGNDTYNLVRIEPSGTGFAFTKKPIPNLVHNINNGMFIGDFDKDGNMYVAGDYNTNTNGPIFKITINADGSGSATKLSIDRGSPRFADWGYTDRVGGQERFYFVSDDGGLYYFSKSGATLIKNGPIASNLATGNQTVVGTFVAGTDLFYYPSGSTKLYKVDLLNLSAGSQPFSNIANPSSNGDAARNYQVLIPALALGKEVTNGTTFTQGSDIRYKLTIKNAGDYPLGDPAFNSQYTVTDTINSQKVTTTATAVTAKLYNSLTGTSFTSVAGFPTTITYTTVDSTTSKFELKSDGGVLPKIPKGYRLEIEYTLKSKIYSFTGNQDQILNIAVGTVVGKDITSEARVNVITTTPDLTIVKEVDKTSLQKGDTLQYTLTVTNKSTVNNFTGVVVKDILKADVTQVFETFSVYDSNGTTLIGEVIDTDGNSGNNLAYTVAGGQTTINIGTIPTLGVNTTKKYILKGRTKTGLTLSTLVNSAIADSNELDPVPSNEVTTTITGEQPFDYGDAPDTYKTITSNPPRHIQASNTPYFGNGVDYETLWTQALGANADLDDRSGSDDEDGIVSVNGVAYDSSLPVLLIEGIENTITVNIGKVLSGGAKVKIWLDGLNGTINNGFDNNNSQVIYDNTATNSGNIDVKFTLKELGNRNDTAGKTYLRMRIVSNKYDNQINSTGGLADDGEVEDYQVFISERKTDFGDLPDTYKTKLSSDGPRHLDVYLFGQTTPVGGNIFLGDTKTYENDAPTSLTGVEDSGDDGVRDALGNILSALYTNENNTLTIKANAPGAVGVWVDFDGDGTFSLNESILQQVVAGDNIVVIPANRFTYDPGLVTTNKRGVRVRYASEKSKVDKPTGLSIGGEVEDYYIPFIKKVTDITIGKTAPATISQEGTIDYTLTLTNTGNVTLKDYILVDKPDTSKVDVTKISKISILLDGVEVSGATFIYNDGEGQFELGGTKPEITAGKSLVIKYTLQSKVFDVTSNNKIPNTVTVITGDIKKDATANVGVTPNKVATLQKTTSTPTISQNGKATYKLIITNTGNTQLTGYTLEDKPDLTKVDLMTLSQVSIKLNGTSVALPTDFKRDSETNPTKLTLVSPPMVPVGQTLEVSYTLDSKLFDTTTDDKIVNTGSLVLTPGGQEIKARAEVQVLKTTGGTIAKNATPSEITLADEIAYKVTVSNTGNTPISLSTFTDTIAQEDKVYIDRVTGDVGTYTLNGGAAQSITATYTDGAIVFTGLPKNLGVKESIVVAYTLKTKNAEYSSANPNIENIASVDLNGNGNVEENEKVTGSVSIKDVKTGTIQKSSAQSSIDQNGAIDYTVVVTNTGNNLINTSLFKDTISSGDKDKVDQVIEGKVKVALIDISADEGTATYQDISATYNQASGEVRFTGLPSVVPIGKKMVVKYSLQTKVFDITLDDTIDNKVQVDINGDNTISDGTETSTASVKVTSKTDVTIDKASSTTLIGQGGTIFYTLTVTNTGNTPISNYILVDKPEPLKVDVTQDIGAIVILDGQVQTGATFKYDSVGKQFVLGGAKPTIPVGKSLVVNYSLKSLVFDATDNKISNTATVTVGDIIKNDVVNVGVDKNIAATLEKTTSTPIISQNGKATYTLTLTNTGNIPLIGYILEDTPNIDKVNLMTLSQVSIKLNGTSVTLPTDFKRDSETDPTKLILVSPPTIPVGQTLEVSYTLDSKVFDITVDDKIVNEGSLALTPGGSKIHDTAEVQVTRTTAGTITKNATSSEITLADKIAYEVTITNTGNTPISLLTFTDTIVEEDRVYIDSVVENTVTYTLNGGNPEKITATYTPGGKIIFADLPKDLGVKESIVIKYSLQTKNAEYSSANPSIENIASVDLNGNGNVEENEKVTDSVSIKSVKTGTIQKSSVQTSIDQSGVIDYTVVVKNTGNNPISTSLFKDTISLEDKDKVEKVTGKVEFALIDVSANEGTATYQDISAAYDQTSGEVIFTGLPDNIPVNEKLIVKYSLQTTVFDITVDDTINNKVQIDINGDKVISDGAETSTASVKVTSKTDVTIDKASSTTLIGQGGTIFYTLTVTNTGNTPISNYILVDKPEPLKVDVTQDIGAIVILDGQVQTGATFKYDSVGKQFVLGGVKPTIPVGKSLVVNYSLKSLVFDATDNKISNTATVTVGDIIKNDEVNVGVNKNIAATLEKTTSTPIISQNGKATYTLKVVNTGNTPLTGYTLEDTPDLTRVSLMTLSQVLINLNGTSVALPTDFKRDSETDPTKLILVSPPTIPVGQALEVSYTLDSKLFDTTTDDKIVNTGSLVLTPGGQEIKAKAEVQVIKTTGGTIAKNATPSDITLADNIYYEVTISNTGNTPISLSTFTDTIAQEDEVYIDGVVGNAGTYILNGGAAQPITATYTNGAIVFTGLPENLGIKESLMIVYTLKTKNAEYSSTNPNIENTVYVDLNGNGNVDAGEKVTEVVKINEVKTGTIKKSSAQSSIDQNGVIDYTVVVTNTGNEAIKTGLFKDTISSEDKEKVEKVTGKVEFALIDVSANEDTATYQDISAAYNQTSGEVIFTGLPSAVPVSKKMVVKYSLQTTVFDTTEDDTIDNMVQIDINGDNTISDGVETSTVPVKVISKTDILLEKTSPMTTITSGEDITYTIKVTNLGNTPLKDYILEDTPEIDKINSDTLKNVVIKLNGSTLDNKNFVFNKNSNKFELINEKPLIPLNGVLEISYTVTSNLNITNISSGVTNTVRFKTDNTEKEATVVVNLSTINITKTANNENQVLQGGDEVVYTIVLKTTSEIEQQVTVKDNLLQVNNYNNSPIIKIEDIKDIKVNGVLLNNGKDIFTAQGLTLIIPGSSQENNLETIITYVLTIPKGISEEVKELKNQGLVIKNNLEIKSEEVVVELAKPKLLLRHDVFKFETKYNDSSQIILQEKPIADNMENIDGKNSKPPIIFAGDDLLYYISLINETEVPMKGEVDINHQLDKKQLKDDNGLNVFIENEFLGIVLTSLDTGEKIFYSEDDLLKIPEAISLGIIDQESSFEFEQLVPARSVISFVEKSKVNPKGIFAKKKEIVTYAYLPSDPLQNTSEGEIRKTVVSIGRKNTDLVLSKRSELEEASVGKFVPYIIQVKNVGEDPATDVYIQDKIPPGFIYVEGSAVQVLNESYTENKITATGVKEIKFGPISEIKSGDIVKIKYLLKVGVGVKPGTYKNIAVSVDNTDKTISNSDSVDVEIISDPIFEHTTIIGKVFHDRDGDGIQDYATAKNIIIDIEVPKNYYVPNTTTVFKNGGTYDFSDSYSRVTIREMKGRVSELEPATNNMVVIRKELKEPTLSTVRVQTNRGTDITQQSDGKVITNHTGDKVKGMTSQDIVIAQRVVKNKDNKIILEIFILNNGIQEEGLPGVRLATPEGIVVETDRFGRYHVPPVPETLGKNYIIKVDPTTLPKGAEFTTENPRVRHLGKVMMKFNFGVKLPPLKNPEKKESK